MCDVIYFSIIIYGLYEYSWTVSTYVCRCMIQWRIYDVVTTSFPFVLRFIKPPGLHFSCMYVPMYNSRRDFESDIRKSRGLSLSIYSAVFFSRRLASCQDGSTLLSRYMCTTCALLKFISNCRRADESGYYFVPCLLCSRNCTDCILVFLKNRNHVTSSYSSRCVFLGILPGTFFGFSVIQWWLFWLQLLLQSPKSWTNLHVCQQLCWHLYLLEFTWLFIS
jgi:hypothetical protein